MQTSGTFDFTLRYQRTPSAKYHVRPLSLLQQDVLYRCDGTVTVADLSDATLYTHPEIRIVLTFLIKHGLVKTVMPEARLFESPGPRSVRYQPSRPLQRQKQPRRFWRMLNHLSIPLILPLVKTTAVRHTRERNG